MAETTWRIKEATSAAVDIGGIGEGWGKLSLLFWKSDLHWHWQVLLAGWSKRQRTSDVGAFNFRQQLRSIATVELDASSSSNYTEM